MIEGKSVLAVIPARGGSKGIPKKNITPLAGKPLIAWTIQEAKKSQYIDRLILSSEDEEIMKVAREWGCEVPFSRPVELAQDTTPGVAPVIHAVTMLPEYDYVVLLQPTSPLRTVEDIDGCIETCIREKANSCVTVCETDKNPYWMYTFGEQLNLVPILQREEKVLRRQEAPKTFVLNGAVYVCHTERLKRNKAIIDETTIGHVMPKERSNDIDNPIDLEICELLLKRTSGK